MPAADRTAIPDVAEGPGDPGVLDVLIIGAGLSGIGAAYRVGEAFGAGSYAVLERRESLGGTWDLFRYPGVRSDSDFFTLSFPFRPWRGEHSIVTGEEIRDYLHTVADENGITDHIRFGTAVTRMSWSSDEALWTVETESTAGPGVQRARFVYACTGYYSYEQPYEADIPGIEQFAGTVVHPQFWPDDLDHTGKRVAVVGSGATAITVVPALAETGAEHVTMIQRTPSYVVAIPRADKVADLARRLLPADVAHSLVRAKNTALQVAVYQACRRAPGLMKSLFRKGAVARTGSEAVVDEHFSPPYDPWDQRLCLSPGGDLFAAIRHETASVVTGTIAHVLPDGVEMGSGEVVPADVLVTATGLNLEIAGGIEVMVDGQVRDLAESFTFRGVMLSGVPNFAVCLGYINLSWTMRADMSSRFVVRLLQHVRGVGQDWVVPVADGQEAVGPLLDMDSGYLRRSAHLQPRAARGNPWRMRQNFVLDALSTNRADLADGLAYGRAAQASASSNASDQAAAPRSA